MKIRHKKNLLGIAVIATASALLFFSSASRKNIINALLLAADTVIPSLFPMLILSDFSARTGLFRPHGKILNKILHTAFGISENGFTAMLFGLCGGYPTAVRTAVSLFEDGKISRDEAKKLCLFCTSPGVAFCITAVGDAMFASILLGVLFFITCTTVNLLTGLLLRPKKDTVQIQTPAMPLTASVAFCKSVAKSAQAMLSIASWMAVFAAAQAILSNILPQSVQPFCLLISEVTAATRLCAQTKNLSVCVATMSFGGLCVFCQLLPELQALQVNALLFLGIRLCNGIAAGLLFALLLFLFPSVGAVPCLYRYAKPFSTTPLSAFFLLIACLFFVLDLAPTQKTCYTDKGR